MVFKIFDKLSPTIKEYERLLWEFLEDNKLSDEEKKKLKESAEKSKLTEKELQRIYKRALSKFFTKIKEDKRITTEEKKALEKLLDYFNLNLEDFNFSQNEFNICHTLALIEAEGIPKLKDDQHNLNVIFKKGEVLHWLCRGELKKYKAVIRRIQYAGPTVSIKITRGLRYRVGDLRFSSQSEQRLITEDVGPFWITDQRVGFTGGRKNFTVPYKKILRFELTPEGLMIVQEGRQNPYILKLDDYDVPCTIISHILNKTNEK